jgi:hypothetical protein
MSIPTFNGTALCSAAAVETVGSPQVRLQMESLPGVDGQYVQTHGQGGRTIEVRGVLTAAGAAPAAAHENLKALLRARQALADGATVATYVGTDAATYANCVLTSYEPAAPVHVSHSGDSYEALLHVTAQLRQLTP